MKYNFSTHLLCSESSHISVISVSLHCLISFARWQDAVRLAMNTVGTERTSVASSYQILSQSMRVCAVHQGLQCRGGLLTTLTGEGGSPFGEYRFASKKHSMDKVCKGNNELHCEAKNCTILFSQQEIRSMECVSAQCLSLIHIWRCRRSTLCRSRWSPYH